MKKSGKHNLKYHALSSVDIAKEKILLPGRRACTCEASKHDLINNCIECGRIVCAQEGSGPCFTCGSLVCTPKEQEAIIRQSKTGVKLYHKLMNQPMERDEKKENLLSVDNKLKSAIEHRDKLLEYDRTTELRTKVIDDESDYFQADSQWLGEKERKFLNKKKEEHYDLMHNRQKQKLTFDFAGRQIIEEKPNLEIDAFELLKPDTSIFDCQDAPEINIPSDLQLVFKDNYESKYTSVGAKEENKPLNIRLQDRELQEMSDEGNCLSLHQPYASLVIAGIKKHEGRTWYTSYRGRLWIHSGGKVPTKQEIAEKEKFYRYISDNCDFPKTYPSGYLLGCVDIVDCLPRDECLKQYPQVEVASPFILIFDNPQQLSIKFPMKGQHKIFKLDSNIHLAAKKTLMRRA